MRRFLFLIHKKVSLMIIAFILTNTTYATVFTAAASGNFSSTATWTGGVVPPTTLLVDQIIIPSGISVNMDNNLTINGALASLTVEGILLTTNSSSLTLNLSTLAGAGIISLNKIDVSAGSTVSFTGSLTAITLNTLTGFSTSATVMVTQTLNLTSGTLSILTGGSLGLSNNATIFVSGGLLTVGVGGSLGLTSNYNVSYTTLSSIAGVELNGSGLQNVTVNVGAANSVTLTSNLTVAGTLSLTSGTLMLAGKNLTINGTIAASGNGTVSSSILSNISFNTAGGTAGTLTFSGIGATVNNITVNVGAGSQAQIDGTVNIAGTLQLNSGTLNIKGAAVTISGTIAGTGSLSANNSTNLTISTLIAAASTLNFETNGQLIGNLTITALAAKAPTLLSNLTIAGALTLSGNSNIILNGNTLTLGVNSTLTGTGYIVSNAGSNLIINATAGVSSLLVSGAIGNFTVNSSGSTAVTLGNNLTTAGTLTLQSGTLVLSGRNLTINGTVAAAGSGTISADSLSNLTIATAGSTGGSLKFTSTANILRNLVINVGGNASANIGSTLNIADTLRFIAGSINIGSNALVFSTRGKITGAGSASYIMTASGGFVQQGVVAGAAGYISFPVGTSTNYAPANIHLNTGSASGQIQVSVVKDVLAQGTTGVNLSATQSLVDATWNINSNITSNLNLNLQVFWSAAMQVNSFNMNSSYISHYTNGSWNKSAATAATVSGSMYSQESIALTSLSPFSVHDNKTNTAVKEINNDLTFTVYPNPATDNITIQNTSTSTEQGKMEIYNSNGQLIMNYDLTNSTSSYSVKDLISGTYYIKFYNNKMNSIKSFIKM